MRYFTIALLLLLTGLASATPDEKPTLSLTMSRKLLTGGKTTYRLQCTKTGQSCSLKRDSRGVKPTEVKVPKQKAEALTREFYSRVANATPRRGKHSLLEWSVDFDGGTNQGAVSREDVWNKHTEAAPGLRAWLAAESQFMAQLTASR
jgi:hypothetical protein